MELGEGQKGRAGRGAAPAEGAGRGRSARGAGGARGWLGRRGGTWAEGGEPEGGRRGCRSESPPPAGRAGWVVVVIVVALAPPRPRAGRRDLEELLWGLGLYFPTRSPTRGRAPPGSAISPSPLRDPRFWGFPTRFSPAAKPSRAWLPLFEVYVE